MSRVNSRSKGQRGERLFRDFLHEHYGDHGARRGQQKKGGEDSPDVESPLLRELSIHPEVKFMKESALTQPAALREWLDQAARDAGKGQMPIVFHRWNRSVWWAIFRLTSGRVVIMTAQEFIDECIQ